MQNVIETDALCKRYGSHLVVDHLALTVPEGCVYGFLGPNGAGKSTTMKMLLGLVHPTGGTVRLLGREMTDANRLALLRQTGSLIESPSGYLHLTARENLEIVADLKGVPHKDISRVLDIVQLTNDQHRKVGQYSLGMKQRLGIAMACLAARSSASPLPPPACWARACWCWTNPPTAWTPPVSRRCGNSSAPCPPPPEPLC